LQLDARQPEYLTPELAGEHQVPIGDDGAGDLVQADDVVKECLHSGGGGSGLWMPQGDEVPIFGEPVNGSQDDELVVHAGEYLSEVHGHVSPHDGRYVEGLQ
jgi:hypothetical protein